MIIQHSFMGYIPVPIYNIQSQSDLKFQLSAYAIQTFSSKLHLLSNNSHVFTDASSYAEANFSCLLNPIYWSSGICPKSISPHVRCPLARTPRKLEHSPWGLMTPPTGANFTRQRGTPKRH
jgi:hypothetical protein